MKKLIILLIILALGVAAYDRWEDFKHRLPEIRESLGASQLLQDIKQEIITSGPLRGSFEAADANLTRSGVIEWTNQQRVALGLSSLLENSQLNRAAEIKARDMLANQYFDHISPDGKGPGDVAQSAGYAFIVVGENLALGNFKNDQLLVDAWMNSPGHRANILNVKYQEIGVAVAQGKFEGRTVWFAVQEFGKPVSSCPQVSEAIKQQIENLTAELEVLEPQLKEMKSSLEQTEPQTKQEADAYNARVAEYNALIKIYNNKVDTIKQLTGQYNFQVRAYNQCLGE